MGSPTDANNDFHFDFNDKPRRAICHGVNSSLLLLYIELHALVVAVDTKLLLRTVDAYHAYQKRDTLD